MAGLEDIARLKGPLLLRDDEKEVITHIAVRLNKIGSGHEGNVFSIVAENSIATPLSIIILAGLDRATGK